MYRIAFVTIYFIHDYEENNLIYSYCKSQRLIQHILYAYAMIRYIYRKQYFSGGTDSPKPWLLQLRDSEGISSWTWALPNIS